MSAPATSLRHERRDPSFEASPLEVGPLTSKAYYVARFAGSHVFGQPGYGSVWAHPRVHLQRGRDTTDGTRRLSTFERNHLRRESSKWAPQPARHRSGRWRRVREADRRNVEPARAAGATGTAHGTEVAAAAGGGTCR
ncbi:hypothetical protein GW17_00021504 [Ensete ventricosum]|nr:hypothetical protein GW17_00021504 [Ensete ventricosum]